MCRMLAAIPFGFANPLWLELTLDRGFESSLDEACRPGHGRVRTAQQLPPKPTPLRVVSDWVIVLRRLQPAKETHACHDIYVLLL